MRLTEDIIDLLDWDRIQDEIYNFKVVKGYWNLVFDINELRDLLLSDIYKILALPEFIEIKTYDELNRVEDVAILIVKKYMELFYRKYAKRFETENLRYGTVGKQLTLFVFEKPGEKYSYILQIDKREKGLIEEIRKLTKNLDNLIKEDTKTLPRIYFDKHLYVPILLQKSEKIDRISPAGLVESEKEFVSGLKDYLKKEKDKFLGIEIYLLRNNPKSGVVFFNLSGFYPDFIMWIKEAEKQKIVFIDPKGLEHTKGLDDEKIKLKDGIKELEQKLGKKEVVLESFIISKTPYNELIKGRTEPPSKDEYINQHVLFLNDSDWPRRLFGFLF
ncbi:MAG: hypothetical protein ACUVUQ_01305 [Thermodesulfovibrionales bacterium]